MKNYLISLGALTVVGLCYALLWSRREERVIKDLGARERWSDSEIAAGHPIVGVS